MSGDFIDSNVFVYLFDETEPAKKASATDLLKRCLSQRSAVISFQVVQETLNVITRKLKVPVSIADAREFLDTVMAPLWRIMPSPKIYHRALDVEERYHYGFFDALILASALEGGCTRLYSEDLQDGQKIEQLVIENPFKD